MHALICQLFVTYGVEEFYGKQDWLEVLYHYIYYFDHCNIYADGVLEIIKSTL